MLAKIVKNSEAANFIPFSIPEIGEAKSKSGSVSQFVIPHFNEIRVEEKEPEIIEILPAEAAPSVEDILQNAREEAEKIIAQAEENSAMIAQAAHEKAVQEVQANFEAEVTERVSEIRDQFAETIKQISSLAGEITARAEDDLVNLALQIAKKIVGREVTIDREIVLTLVKVSLGKLHNRSVAEVHLNPEDFVFVQSQREKLDFRGSLELVEDNSISLGGCLIHTETGDIDGRIESQFDEIAYGLFS